MRIQSKVMLFGTGMLIITLLVLTLFSIIILQPSYDSIERDDTITDLDRGISYLQSDLNGLESTLNDWAFWDETYQFALGKAPTYPEKNLMQQTFTNLNLNGLLIYDQRGELIYAQGFNLTSGAYSDLPDGLITAIAAHHQTLFSGTGQQTVNGTLLLSRGPVLIVAAPILTSTFDGPPAGTMMMIRSLDDRWLDQFHSKSGIPISILTSDQTALVPDGTAPLLDKGEPVVVPENGSLIRGYQQIPCLDGDDALLLSIEQTRTISRTGAATIDGYLKIIVVFSVLSALLVIILLRRLFLAPLHTLTTGVIAAQRGDRERQRVATIRGNDELTILGRAINQMLETIEASQAATEASEARYRGVVEDQTELICRVDTGFMVRFMNRAFKQHFASDLKEEEPAPTFLQMIPDPVRAPVLSFLAGLNPQEPVRETEIGYPCRESTCWMAWTVRGIFDGAGALTEYQFVGRDVTAQKQALIELKQYHDHLEEVVTRRTEEMMGMQEELLKIERLESIGVLAGGIAHDFNNLLAAILGNIELIRMDLDETSPLDKQMAELERVVHRATSLTRQLLTFARGGAPIRRMAHLGQMIQDTVEFTCRGSPVRCTCRVSEDLWITEVDLDQISQVINNIVLNAVQAMPDGGTITVTVENLIHTGAETIPLMAGRYVKITLADDGPGIPADLLSRIFDPFFTTKTAGSGLGLSTSFSIIRQHNGLLQVASTPGDGTTFTILIPAAPDTRTTQEPGSS